MKCLFSFLFTLLFLVSCGPPEFEKNTRILVKGNIVDENNNPMSNVNIDIYTVRGFTRSGSNYLLGGGISNEKGGFLINSLFDKNKEFKIQIYGEQTHTSYRYLRNTKDNPTRNLTYDLNTVTLHKLAVVNYNITRTSPPNTELNYSFQYKSTDCIEVYDDGGLNLVQSNCLEELTLNRVLTENNPEVSRNLTTLLGSVVTFTYTINDESEKTETFTIDSENYEFNFSY